MTEKSPLLFDSRSNGCACRFTIGVTLEAGEAARVRHDWFSDGEFEGIVSDALDSLPERFAKLIQNVAIIVEDEPNEDDFDSMEDDDSELLGIYRGVSLMERMNEPPTMPDEIAIFRGPISRVARTRAEAINEVRDTVIHEIGHYFGLDEKDLP